MFSKHAVMRRGLILDTITCQLFLGPQSRLNFRLFPGRTKTHVGQNADVVRLAWRQNNFGTDARKRGSTKTFAPDTTISQIRVDIYLNTVEPLSYVHQRDRGKCPHLRPLLSASFILIYTFWNSGTKRTSSGNHTTDGFVQNKVYFDLWGRVRCPYYRGVTYTMSLSVSKTLLDLYFGV